ncbi:hypothetical protein PHYSODRAFT_494393 [Phytophthora sojae]|uniref:Uncharacterized protein n=1 Tax=Phytophthora sojae (strain P6497) TaxID=1094619 RepID=G4Z3J1_PHYSP|nr:hypothetical protein PHYSODRAFT_494393 [Phytophthora sojae]EGZ19363.1 hypothetical protein PHYSODRAFT_494393 [Phytophthora sojae]|eukprot:XP_009522080.1 hypothetical protein PHYSODRAFT_494393 [Phytophthora sojae]
MRSPTKIRTPTKLARPRETHWASKAKDVKKRLLEAGDGSLSSALPPPKRTKLSAAQTSTQQKTVARCLEEELLRDNARMRLKASSLRDEVDFYYGVLARIELVAAQQTRAGGDRSKELQEQVMRVAERLQRIISASKPAVTAVESNGHHTQT